MLVSAIIPYHRSKTGSDSPYLDLCLSSLLRELPELGEIIVVENGPGCSGQLANASDGPIRVVSFSQSLGYSRAVNQGAARAAGEFLLLCDADTFFPETGWLVRHLDFQKSKDEIGITGSKLIDSRTNRVLDFGIGRTRFNHFHPFRDARLEHPLVQGRRRVQMACSAVMLIRREVFNRLGGFDEDLRFHYQDVDLCLRLKRLGNEVWVLGDTPAYHRSGSAEVVREPFQIDERAYYTAKNAGLMEIDFPKYLDESLLFYAEHLQTLSPFAVVDLSTMYDPAEALDIVAKYADLQSFFKLNPPHRDIEQITLVDLLNMRVAHCRLPLLFLVDRHISLGQNALWRSIRDTSADIVVDRHANVCSFEGPLAATKI